MGMTKVLPALFAAAAFALPATASAQWAPSPTIIIVNPSPAFGTYEAGAQAWPQAWPLRLLVGIVVQVGAAVVPPVGAAVAVSTPWGWRC
jgi:hypothetical protein